MRSQYTKERVEEEVFGSPPALSARQLEAQRLYVEANGMVFQPATSPYFAAARERLIAAYVQKGLKKYDNLESIDEASSDETSSMDGMSPGNGR